MASGPTRKSSSPIDSIVLMAWLLISSFMASGSPAEALNAAAVPTAAAPPTVAAAATFRFDFEEEAAALLLDEEAPADN